MGFPPEAATSFALRSALRTALAHPEGVALGVAIPHPALTVLVASAEDPAEVLVALEEFGAALERCGIKRGRMLALLPPAADGVPRSELACTIRRVLAFPGIAHDPDRSACFPAGRTRDGVRLELNDELREAEAVVLAVGLRPRAGDGHEPAVAALLPGLASRATCRALAALGFNGAQLRGPNLSRVARETLEHVPVDFALAWWRGPGGAPFARAGSVSGALLDPLMHGG